MKAILQALAHAALGGAAVAVAPLAITLIPSIPNLNPLVVAAIMSAATSVLSLYSKPPSQ